MGQSPEKSSFEYKSNLSGLNKMLGRVGEDPASEEPFAGSRLARG